MQSVSPVLTLVLATMFTAPPQGVPVTSSQPADRKGAIVEYAEGVRINWPQMQVELDAVVVLRSGPLELFGCSPHTREHESILRVPARPVRICEALGLIGLTPGRPVTYEAAADDWLPATGDTLEVEVSYRQGGQVRTAKPWDWMKDARTGAAARPGRWIFCGSRRFEDGSFGADHEGTVLCVVDFGTALIGLAEQHTADNAALWLMADPDVVPPVGTRCTLVIRAADSPTLVHCGANGRYRLDDGAWLTRAALHRAIATRKKDGRLGPVVLRLEPGGLGPGHAGIERGSARPGRHRRCRGR